MLDITQPNFYEKKYKSNEVWVNGLKSGCIFFTIAKTKTNKISQQLNNERLKNGS